MEITVVDEEENPMLHRTDVRFRVSHVEATPDRLAIRDSLAARLNKDADEVVIRKLDTKFGMRTTYGEAKVYESPDFAQDVEQDYVLQRNKIAAGGVGDAEVESEAAEPAADASDVDAEATESEETTDVEAADDVAPDAEEVDEASADAGEAEPAAEAEDVEE